MIRRALIAAIALCLPASTQANDSEAAIGLGGLELVQNGAVTMDSEDLFISRELVRVTYRYTNRTAKDADITVSFPVPAIPGDLRNWLGDGQVPDLDRLKFKTQVDGRPVTLSSLRRAEIKGRDVTARLKALGWPMAWFTGEASTPDFVHKLSPQQRAAFIREGLLRRDPRDPDYILPAWDMVTHATRRQVFPAGRTVTASHEYAPLAGGSVAGSLYPEFRKTADWQDHARLYCIDKDFLAAFDAREARNRKARPDSPNPYGETWLHYILRSGRNWKGPIRDFRLVIDKGKADNLVSFCMNGVKKISPTRFEVRKANFEPAGDLQILIVEWFNTD
ncbi:MAG: DUF4424 family protein [Novosphingobium sp.]